MFQRNIYDHYRLFCDELFSIGKYEGFQAEGNLYITVPANLELQQELEQQLEMAEYLRSNGESGIASLVKTIHGEQTALVDGQTIFLFQCPIGKLPDLNQTNLGEKLGTIHQKGKYYQHKGSLYFGQWKYFWQKRLEQLEQWYQYIFEQPEKSLFDQAFILTFPYYMGLSESAIQYIVDTELDVREWESPTICHRRFGELTWLTLMNQHEQSIELQLPTEWVVDHPARDIAEWIREQRLYENGLQQIKTFLFHYEKANIITPYSWRLLYARLLFPLDYFEAVEGYYQKRMDEKVFFQVLEEEEQNQAFLSQMFQQLAPENQSLLPRVDWLR